MDEFRSIELQVALDLAGELRLASCRSDVCRLLRHLDCRCVAAGFRKGGSERVQASRVGASAHLTSARR